MPPEVPYFAPCTAGQLPVANNACRSSGTYFVTSQPIYNGGNPYPAIASAGIKTVLCMRDPSEVTTEPYPFDLTEPGQLILANVTYTNIPLPHSIPTSTGPGAPEVAMTQGQFNLQATNAATLIERLTKPLLVHCSTGDRASAAFAVYLINYCGLSNAAAALFAQNDLLLQNKTFIGFVENYSKPASQAA